jgi:hypothetical protein
MPYVIQATGNGMYLGKQRGWEPLLENAMVFKLKRTASENVPDWGRAKNRYDKMDGCVVVPAKRVRGRCPLCKKRP